MILGLTALRLLFKGIFKSHDDVCVSLMLASVGQDTLSDIPNLRLTMNLSDGISFVLVVMATFAEEALTIIIKGNEPQKSKQISLTDLGSLKSTKKKQNKWPQQFLDHLS